MSGPKVVNIEAVRRRQRRVCNALMLDLAAAVDECLRLQNSDAAVTGEFRDRADALIARLNGLRASEKWSELQTETSAHRDFYRSEAEGLRQRAIERRASSLRREHHLRQGAAQLVAELSCLPSSPARDAALQQISTARDTVSLQGAVTQAAALVSGIHRDRIGAANVTRIRELAAAFADPLGEDPTAKSPEADRDPDEVRLERCWSLLGELETFDAGTSFDSWKQKAGSIAAVAAGERSLLLDSLALELTSHLRARRAQQTAIASVQSVVADLTNVSAPESQTWRTKLNAALLPPLNIENALALAASARLWLEQEISREDALEQRAAVLRALITLGYEVREGMATAWTEKGRVVIHKPADRVYGLELSAPPTGPAFQVRVVAAGSQGRSKQRDYEVEQVWCGEFARLQSILAANGFPTKLAQAHAPGVIPVKTVAGETAKADTSRILKERTLPRTDAE